MSYVKYIIGLFLYSTLITQSSISLGLTSDVYVISSVEGLEDPSGLESLFIAINFVVSNMNTFLQLVTLQADIPFLLSLIFAGSLGLGVVVAIVLIIRGIG